jgi:enterochelin esterase family protein
MIVVMENGMVAPNIGSEDLDNRGRRNAAFERLVVKDLVPEIDRVYRTIADREHRAVAGLSMGAGQATRIGMENPAVFSFVGAFSGGLLSSDALLKDPGLKLYWVGWGSAEAERFVRIKELLASAKAEGFPIETHQVDGTAHEWQTWRYCLREFAPLLFQ